jgi:hypothetical protein
MPRSLKPSAASLLPSPHKDPPVTHEHVENTSNITVVVDKAFTEFVEANLDSCVQAIAHLQKHGTLPAGALRLQLRHLSVKKIPHPIAYAESVISSVLIARVAAGEYLRTLPIDTAPKDGTVVVVNDTTGLTQWCEAKYIEGEHWSGWAYSEEVCTDTNPGGPVPTRWIPPRAE